MYILSKPMNLDGLPNELLYMIMEYVGEERHLPRKFRVAHALSLVNRRLRGFIVPFLFRHLQYSNYIRFYFFHLMITDPGMRARIWGTDYANYVRSLCVGADRTLTNLKTSKSLEEEMSFPFPFLRCLEFLDRAPHRDIMSSLLSTPFLENLTMTWVETWAFPMIDRHRHLHTLRLKIIPSPCRYSLPEKTYACLTEHELSSLTTLHIANYFEADWADHFWLQSKFPNLRVINVQNTRATCRTVFNFVHCHPTLLEVNIGFIDAIDIRLEAILKLIDGTGSWRTPGGLETFVERGNPRCFYITTDGRRNYLDEPEMDMEKLTVFPDDIPNTRFTTASFAFKRVPLSPEATQGDKREGSSKARYQATEFAILLSSQDFLEFSGAAFGHFHEFFLLADRFPAVEVLRVASQTHIPTDYDFVEYMTTIGFALEKWTKLKKVALSFTADEDFFTWGWHDSPHIPTVDQRSIWEHAIPPSDRWPTEEFSDSLDRLREDASIDDPEKIEVIDSAQFKIHFENDLLEHDLAYLMRLWQEKNEPSLARFMRNLGDCCPSLEQIDWYPLGGGDPRTLWRWNFLRELRDDKRKVKRVMGNLSWEGCTQGDPDPMVALVGQEWEHHVSVHMKRRY